MVKGLLNVLKSPLTWRVEVKQVLLWRAA